MTVSKEDSDGVSDALVAASAPPTKTKAVAATATPVRTRLATSGGIEAQSPDGKLAESVSSVALNPQYLR
jgi:hypothetical protein